MLYEWGDSVGGSNVAWSILMYSSTINYWNTEPVLSSGLPTNWNEEFACVADRRLLWTTSMHVGECQEKGGDDCTVEFSQNLQYLRRGAYRGCTCIAFHMSVHWFSLLQTYFSASALSTPSPSYPFTPITRLLLLCAPLTWEWISVKDGCWGQRWGVRQLVNLFKFLFFPFFTPHIPSQHGTAR